MSVRRPPVRCPAREKAAREGATALWAMVEGAVVDAFTCHPEYLTGAGRHAAVGSITKRVVGTLVGHADELRKEGRLGGCTAGVGTHDSGHGRTSANAFAEARGGYRAAGRSQAKGAV